MRGEKTWIVVALIALGLLAVALLVLVYVNRLRLDRTNARLVTDLLAESQPPSGAVFSLENLQGLPSPVQRYLARVIGEGQPYVKSVRLHQVGEFRLGNATAPRKALEAHQHFSVKRPGFVWVAAVAAWLGLPMYRSVLPLQTGA
jgi:hypothetical protein